MSGDKFKLPTIPPLHVPQYIPVQQADHHRPAKPIQTTTNTRAHVTKRVEQEEVPSEDGSAAAAARSLVTNFPKLCPSCSASLLQYLQPLQLYINQLVTITSGMAGGCEHVQIISKMQELPHILKLSEVPAAASSSSSSSRTTRQDQSSGSSSSGGASSSSQGHEHRHHQATDTRHHHVQSGGSNERSHKPALSHGHQNPRHDSGRGTSQGKSHEKQHVHFSQTQSHHQDEGRHSRDLKQEAATHRAQQQGSDEKRHGKQDHHKERDRGHHSVPTRFTESSTSSDSSHRQQQQQQHHPASSEGHETADSSPDEEAHIPETQDASNESHNDDSDERPFAFVTIVYDNLSAINAIILCNSVSLSCTKQVRFHDKVVTIPFVAVVAGHVDPALKDHLANVFDEVFFENRDARLSMLMDESFGVSQVKIQLWKRLSGFEKCFFIESTSLVVGNIDDVFLQFHELSACVDWMFPDSFACSVFVFEPKIQTYDQLMKYASDIVQNNDDPEVPPADDMTILNQFFASKWCKMSFIYNYSQNTAVYTQQPAFAKFGGSVKIVNFDFTPISGPGAYTGHSNGSNDSSSNGPSTQPWHVSFDLNRSTQVGEVSTHHQVNNYVKFYLNIFLKRVWPLIRSPLTPLLLARNKHDWSIYELVGLLKNPGQDLDQSMPYSPIILRRRDPTFQYDSVKDPASVTPPVPEQVQEEEGDDVDQEVPESTGEQSVDNKDSEPADETAEVLVPDLRNDRRIWESGNPDWIGAHGSDKLIDRLKDKFK